MNPRAETALIAVLAIGLTCIAAGFFLFSARLALIATGVVCVGTAWRWLNRI
jgi:hypothetical protein